MFFLPVYCRLLLQIRYNKSVYYFFFSWIFTFMWLKCNIIALTFQVIFRCYVINLIYNMSYIYILYIILYFIELWTKVMEFIQITKPPGIEEVKKNKQKKKKSSWNTVKMLNKFLNKITERFYSMPNIKNRNRIIYSNTLYR